MPTITISTPGSYPSGWPGYIGVTLIDVECWGGGQAGEDGGLIAPGAGGNAGHYAATINLSVTENTPELVVVGAGGVTSLEPGGDTYIRSVGTVCGSGGGSSNPPSGSFIHPGGAGPAGAGGVGSGGGGGGGSAGNGQAGFAGDDLLTPGAGGDGGTGNAGTPGTGGTPGVNGGDGSGTAGGGGGGGGDGAGNVGGGGFPGGGGGGSNILDNLFGVGGAGKVKITWTWPTPDPLSISPASGPAAGFTAGGTAVTITGTPGTFSSGCRVFFGVTEAIGTVVVDNATITCTTPPHLHGATDVTVKNTDDVSRTLSAAWLYIAPTPSRVQPAGGVIAGGTTVTISDLETSIGSFSPGITVVTFGGNDATAVTVNNPRLITCVTPSHPVGTVTVSVNDTVDTTNPLNDGFAYFSTTTPTPVIVKNVNVFHGE